MSALHGDAAVNAAVDMERAAEQTPPCVVSIHVEVEYVQTDDGPFWRARIGSSPWSHARDRLRAVRYAILEGLCSLPSPVS